MKQLEQMNIFVGVLYQLVHQPFSKKIQNYNIY